MNQPIPTEIDPNDPYKQTREAMTAIMETLAIILPKFVTDGAQMSDVVELWNENKDDPEFMLILEKGMGGVEVLKMELASISFIGTMDLLMVFISYIPRVIDALQKQLTPDQHLAYVTIEDAINYFGADNLKAALGV